MIRKSHYNKHKLPKQNNPSGFEGEGWGQSGKPVQQSGFQGEGWGQQGAQEFEGESWQESTEYSRSGRLSRTHKKEGAS